MVFVFVMQIIISLHIILYEHLRIYAERLTIPLPLASQSIAFPSLLAGLDRYRKNVSAHRAALQTPLMYLRIFNLSAGSTLLTVVELTVPSKIIKGMTRAL